MVQFDDIDDVFREAAGEYRITPGDSAWRRLRRQLLWRKLRYVIGAGMISAVALLLVLLLAPGDEAGQPEAFPLLHTEVAAVSVVSEANGSNGNGQEAQSQRGDVRAVTSDYSPHSAGAARYPGYLSPAMVEPPASDASRMVAGVVGRMSRLPGRLAVPVIRPIVVKRKTGDVLMDSRHDSAAVRWSVDLFSGFSFSQFAGFSAGLPGHEALRDDGSWLLTPVAGVGLRMSKKGWFASMGLHWNRVGQKVNFDVATTELDSRMSHYEYDTTWVWIYDPPYYGEPFPASVDSTFVSVYQRQMFRGTLATDYLTIPLLLGYEYRSGALALSAGAGLSFSIPVAWHGSSPNARLNGLVAGSHELSHQMDIGLQMRIEGSARIASRYWLFFRPVARIGLSNHSGGQSSLLYRNNSTGLDVGVRIDLNP